jgi:RNA polymerase sigma-70 factor (ECF subfamily)
MQDRFETTNWRLVLAARSDAPAAARAALGQLCETYWYAVYAFIRRQGHAAPDAEDLTQAYFTRFLEKDYLKAVRPEAGRFRAFVLASVRHFLSNERDRLLAAKRGGRRIILSLDVEDAEQRLRLEPADHVTPETLFERNWASAVLAQALDRLRAELEATEGPERFRRLGPHLTGDAPAATYAELAREMGVSEAAIRVAVHRLRKRFGALLRDEIARTVEDPEDVEQEVRYLLSVIG